MGFGGSSYRRGDRVDEEFGQFVAARGVALCRTAYLLTGDWQVGEDLVQEALTRTYLRRRRLRSAEALEPYARKVLGMAARMTVRQGVIVGAGPMARLDPAQFDSCR